MASPVGAYEALSVNISGANGTETTQSLAVRQAIAKAIDRSQIVKTVFGGVAEVGRSQVPLAVLGPAASQVQGGPAYDPAGAKRLLESDGWTLGGSGIYQKGGKPLRLTLVSGFPTPDVHRPLPEVLQQQLRAVGIDVVIVEAPDYDDAASRWRRWRYSAWCRHPAWSRAAVSGSTAPSWSGPRRPGCASCVGGGSGWCSRTRRERWIRCAGSATTSPRLSAAGGSAGSAVRRYWPGSGCPPSCCAATRTSSPVVSNGE